MIICVCRNLNEALIKKEASLGNTAKDIIKKYKCTECRMCVPYIKKLVSK